jgi:hypothetical protein
LANIISYPSMKPSRFVNYLSRYSLSKVLYYGDNKKVTFTTYKRKPIEPSSYDKFIKLNSSNEYRPDSVSQQAYGFPDYWWKIMQFNGIKDIKDFKAGMTIRIPVLD